MQSLAIDSVLVLIEHMSYDEREKLKDLIFKDELDNYYQIIVNNIKYCIKAKNRKDAVNKYIKSDKFITNHIRSSYVLQYTGNSKMQCYICGEFLDSIIFRYTSYMISDELFTEHFKSHMKQTIKIFNRIFEENYSCIKLSSYFECDDELVPSSVFQD